MDERLSQSKKGKDGHNHNDQTDQVNDPVHFGAPPVRPAYGQAPRIEQIIGTTVPQVLKGSFLSAPPAQPGACRVDFGEFGHHQPDYLLEGVGRESSNRN